MRGSASAASFAAVERERDAQAFVFLHAAHRMRLLDHARREIAETDRAASPPMRAGPRSLRAPRPSRAMASAALSIAIRRTSGRPAMPPTPSRTLLLSSDDRRDGDDGEVAVAARHFAKGDTALARPFTGKRTDAINSSPARAVVSMSLLKVFAPRARARRAFERSTTSPPSRRAPAAIRSSGRHGQSSRTPYPCCGSGNVRHAAARRPQAAVFRQAAATPISLFWVTAAPISIVPPRSWIASSAAICEISISTSVSISRRLSIGTSDWPPARMRASSPYSASSADRLLDRIGPDVIERARLHVLCVPAFASISA